MKKDSRLSVSKFVAILIAICFVGLLVIRTLVSSMEFNIYDYDDWTILGIYDAIAKLLSMIMTILICIEFVLFLIWSFRFCKKTARAKGLPESYKWFGFLFLIGVIILVLAPPAKDVAVDTDDKNRNKGSATEELYKFKKLYDQGIITKEEFLAKKEELLKR